jgi:sialate O-acetylesterase
MQMPYRFLTLYALLLLSLLPATVTAAPRPAPYFTDHAVLPAGRPVPVWGRADPGEQVQVEFAGRRISTTAADDGTWSADLPAMPAGTRGEMCIEGRGSVTLHDVVTGEIWFCAGQSNMEWTVAKSMNADAEIRAADFPDIRHFKVTLKSSPAPLDAFVIAGPAWQPASSETVGSFTAVGYYFAREIHRRLGVPVGLINATWGGTPIHPWMSPPSIEGWEHYGQLMENKRKEIADWPRRSAENDARLVEWQEQAAQAQKNGREPPARPWFPGPPDAGQYMPGQLYNAMIHPFTRIPLRGFLWYQGESNAGGGEGGGARYTTLQNRLIHGWREAWSDGSLPFLFVQLAGFRAPSDPTGISWAFFRGGQQASLEIPNTDMATAMDIGDPDDVHPTNKQEVGRRLALLALSDVYQKTGIVSRGPEFATAVPGNGEIRVNFRHARGGLRTRDGKPPAGFEIAGEDRVFHPADTLIDGTAVIVRHVGVPVPHHVRHAFHNHPQHNLTNAAGLPALPFRSDGSKLR